MTAPVGKPHPGIVRVLVLLTASITLLFLAVTVGIIAGALRIQDGIDEGEASLMLVLGTGLVSLIGVGVGAYFGVDLDPPTTQEVLANKVSAPVTGETQVLTSETVTEPYDKESDMPEEEVEPTAGEGDDLAPDEFDEETDPDLRFDDEPEDEDEEADPGDGETYDGVEED